MQVDRGREQPDPEESRRRAAEASTDAAGARPTTMGNAGPASAEPRRRIRGKRPARPEERREEQRDGGGDDPDREEPPTRRQRVARAAVRLRALVAMTGKTDDDQCWGCNVVYDGGGFCDECVTELQEQCVQDDVRLAGYAAELARTVGAAGEGETREAYDVVAGPSLCGSHWKTAKGLQRVRILVGSLMASTICMNGKPVSHACAHSVAHESHKPATNTPKHIANLRSVSQNPIHQPAITLTTRHKIPTHAT